MFRVSSLILVVSALVFAVSIPADQLIRGVEQRYNNARTLSVNFSENYLIQGHARRPESGTLTVRKQGKMRWDYSQPEGKLFLSDGKQAYLYTAWDNRVEKAPLKNTEDMRVPLAFLLGRLDIKKEFCDFQVRPDAGGTWLSASAKNGRAPYNKIEMLIAPDDAVRQLKLFGRDQSVLSFTFTNEKLNLPVSDQLFHFTIPPGAEVVNSIDTDSGEN